MPSAPSVDQDVIFIFHRINCNKFTSETTI